MSIVYKKLGERIRRNEQLKDTMKDKALKYDKVQKLKEKYDIEAKQISFAKNVLNALNKTKI